jgi:glutamate synthase (NADPH/NADH) large chain
LIQIPDALYRDWAKGAGVNLPRRAIMPLLCASCRRTKRRANLASRISRAFIVKEGQTILGWRDVPTTLDGLGKAVIEQMPVIRQLFIGRGENCVDQDAFERKLLAIRKQAQNPLFALWRKSTGCPALAASTSPQCRRVRLCIRDCSSPDRLAAFYDDLRNPLCQSALALVHQRFSTNTFPSWKLAHPYRFVAHNGEINTVRGNVNWMNARSRTMESDLMGPISTRCGRSFRMASQTRRASTMRSNCCSRADTALPMR